jgi:hypothetical protein
VCNYDRPGTVHVVPDPISRAQLVAQAQVAKLVPGAKLVTKTHSGHDIMQDNPHS